jgi:hypothetical protein
MFTFFYHSFCEGYLCVADKLILEYYSKCGIGLIKIAPSVAHDIKGVFDLCIE